jgi:hypothetical protein
MSYVSLDSVKSAESLSRKLHTVVNWLGLQVLCFEQLVSSANGRARRRRCG